MNEIYEKRRKVAREKAARISAYLQIEKVSKRDQKEARAYLENLARRNGLTNEFREKGYL